MLALPLLGLAPGGGCLAAGIAAGAGGLLHHLFILTEGSTAPASGMFLWPDPAGCPTPGVTRHGALWSADFPRPRVAEPRPPGRPEVSLSYYSPAGLSICAGQIPRPDVK